jgi:hypothetical protein
MQLPAEGVFARSLANYEHSHRFLDGGVVAGF